MSLLDPIRDMLAPPMPAKLPVDVQERLTRGRSEMMRNASKRRLCIRFRHGDSYFYLNNKGFLFQQNTAPGLGSDGRPSHRIRNKYDQIGPIVDAKVSSATARPASYEASPSTTDPQDIGGARLAEKVALYGRDKWRMRLAKEKTVDNAITCNEGFAMPYFDPNIGPFTEVDGEMVGQGEIRILTLTGNEVYWEPGVDFEESRWYCIERAMPLDEIRKLPGFVGGKLVADASASDLPTDNGDRDNLAILSEYFERPCPDYPEGRCITQCNGKPIVDYRKIDPLTEQFWGPYPLQNHDGTVIDEPLIHRLVYRVDGEGRRTLAGVWDWIDFQRTYQDCWNKILEWKNRCLNPKMKAPINSLVRSPTDVPGDVDYFKWQPGMPVPEWEKVPTDWVAPLQSIMQQAKNDLREAAGDEQFTADPRVSGDAIEAASQQNQGRTQTFQDRVEDWESRVIRHCLLLVGRYYTEPRLLKIRGRWGQPQNLGDFLGADLMGQVDIRVIPGSTQPRSRQQVMQELAWVQANFPGYLTPEVAIAAIRNGTAEDLIQGYELDMSRVNGVIQRIVDGTVLEMPDRQQWMPGPPDPLTGQPGPSQMVAVPAFMPSENDSLAIWERMFGDFLKTDEYLRLDPAMQEVANQIWAGIKWQEEQAQAKALMARNAMAADLGADNAAKPQVKGMPSQPGDGQSPPAQP